jgi:hypothetical protein
VLFSKSLFLKHPHSLSTLIVISVPPVISTLFGIPLKPINKNAIEKLQERTPIFGSGKTKRTTKVDSIISKARKAQRKLTIVDWLNKAKLALGKPSFQWDAEDKYAVQLVRKWLKTGEYTFPKEVKLESLKKTGEIVNKETREKTIAAIDDVLNNLTSIGWKAKQTGADPTQAVTQVLKQRLKK